MLFFDLKPSGAVFQNQVLYQSCIVVFKYNDTICNDIGTGKANSDPQVFVQFIRVFFFNSCYSFNIS